MKRARFIDAAILFLELEELGSFEAVAKRRGVASSTVLREMKSFGRCFPEPVIETEGRRTALTSFGKRLAQSIRDEASALFGEEGDGDAPSRVLLYRDPRLPVLPFLEASARLLWEEGTMVSVTASEPEKSSAGIRAELFPARKGRGIGRTLAASPGLFRGRPVPTGPDMLRAELLLAVPGDRLALRRLGVSGSGRVLAVPDYEAGIALAKLGAGIFVGAFAERHAREVARNELTLLTPFEGLEANVRVTASPSCEFLLPVFRALFRSGAGFRETP